MDLRKLKYFCAVAEFKSFSRASLNLRIAQPALSRQVKQLEEELEVSLFHRDGRGAHLTEAGAELYRHATRIQDRILDASKSLKKFRDTSLQEVAIGAPPTVGAHFLAEVAAQINAYNPEISLRVIEGYSEQLADWLVTGRLDIALLYQVRAKASIEIRQTVLERLCLLTPPGHALTRAPTVQLAELSGATILSPGLPSTTRDCLEAVADSVGVPLTYRMQVDSIPALKAMVASGMGCAVLPMAAAIDEIDRGDLACAEIVNPSANLELVIGVSHLGKVSKDIYRVCDLMRDHIREQTDKGIWRATIL